MSDLPEGWEERTSRSTGQTYFLNQFTKQSQWDRPTQPAQPAPTQVRPTS
jgi:NIMA-interacting peptidyl-prolyl cis-trans isomerase 1